MVDLVALASPLWSRLATVALASALPAISMAQASGLAAPRSGTGGAANSASGQAAATPVAGAMQLKVRRLSDSVELVIEGAGMAPQLRQSGGATGWQGDLTVASTSGLRVGPQRLSIPELGFQTITFDGSGSNYRIGINPVAGAPLGRPVVSADGQNLILSFPATSNSAGLPVARFNATQPGFIPRPAAVPPLQPRAVAPPLGDMAVGSMTLRNPGYVNVSGPPITMTMKNAPAKDVLMALAQVGGYGFAYVDDQAAAGQQGEQGNASSVNRVVSIAFKGETYSRALNTALLAAGLQGRKEGNMIFAGPNVLSKTFGAQLSKVYRLNQVSANSAADYLATLGATVSKTNTLAILSTGYSSASTFTSNSTSNQSSSQSQTAPAKIGERQQIDNYSSNSGPLLGLRATTDTRLSTITLVGDPGIVAIAEQYLKQLDLRQRQVALSVKILDVSLANDAVIENSFAFRFGNNFIVNDGGQLLGAFGRSLPAGSASFDQIQTTTTTTSSNAAANSTSANGEVSGETDTLVINESLTNDQLSRINSILTTATGQTIATDAVTGLPVVVNTNATGQTDVQANISSIQRIVSQVAGRNVSVTRSNSSNATSANGNTVGTTSGYTSRTRPNPGLNYPDNSFYDFVRSVITSQSTKILASPTLVLSENSEEIKGGAEVSAEVGETSAATIGRPRANESYVTVGEQVVTSYAVQAGQNGAPNTCQPEFGIAGLTFGARVSKIDDNGFVTFSMSPAITASTRQQGIQGCGLVDILAIRRLDTGSARVRDGQTLIMTGVISDSDIQSVSKWPILGDLPLVGQFFRSSSGGRDKRELVIMVTPRIINDYEGGNYGYGYQPETRQARDAIGASVF